jgi:hypothetical protein
MSIEGLSAEQQEKLKAATSLEEMQRIAAEEGFELSEELLDGISGGNNPCSTQDCRTYGVSYQAIV